MENKAEIRKFITNELHNMLKFARNKFKRVPCPKLRLVYKERSSFCDKDDEDNYVIQLSVIDALESSYFYEYIHICRDKEIGGFYSATFDAFGEVVKNWKKYLACVLCHELAHMIDLENQNIAPTSGIMYYDASKIEDVEQVEFHGNNWQYIYRVLRNEFVNWRDFK